MDSFVSRTGKNTLADRIRGGDLVVLRALLADPLIPRSNNLIERPWGGRKLISFKGLDENASGPRIGESFELAAWSSDAEAVKSPSLIDLEDGSSLTLGEVLAAAGPGALGGPNIERGLPLLPKFLSVAELLSVQGHPPGNTEIYVVVDAEPGASLFLGFADDQDPAVIGAHMRRGREQQARLAELLRKGVSQTELQRGIAPALAGARPPSTGAWDGLRDCFPAADWPEVEPLLEELHGIYHWVLGQLNEIPVVPGMTIHNRNPARVLADGAPPSAEVHALGNPARKELLALEIRKPGPTLRAWDHVRFPIRPVDIDGALQVLSSRKTSADDFVVTPRSHPTLPGAELLVEEPGMLVGRMKIGPGSAAASATGTVHSLHVISGEVMLKSDKERLLPRGASALVTLGCPSYEIASAEGAEVIRVDL